MYQPGATYRIQFNKDFTLSHLEAIIPYLHRLGIKTIYASPIFAAMPGSMHGYDGIDPNRINPEIGTWEQLKAIGKQLKERNMGWLQDFVPNHMAFSSLNPWLCDFLQKGKMSAYDDYFDKNPDEPLMAPFLGTTLREALDQKAFSILYKEGELLLHHEAATFPLNYSAYSDIFRHPSLEEIPMQSVKGELDLLSQITDKTAFRQQWEKVEIALRKELQDKRKLKHFGTRLAKLSQDTSFLERILEFQFYRPCHWKESSKRINYRRFFTVNSLICMNMQREEVFDHYHQLLFTMIEDDIIQGVRIDHIDGLYDPGDYLYRLRKKTGRNTYIVVEKILAHDEELPLQWPVQGTTGYDFTTLVTQVQTNRSALKDFTKAYPFKEQGRLYHMAHSYKQKMLQEQMQGELANLLHTFTAIEGMIFPSNVDAQKIRDVISAALVYCPVYRFYPQRVPLEGKDLQDFNQLITQIKQKIKRDQSSIDFFASCFRKTTIRRPEGYYKGLLHFWRRCMQLSGPLMAKGIEDTWLYNMNRFIALNEVGNDPMLFGITTDAFHKKMIVRARQSPCTINATATHDTKRGEDARSRLAALSLDPQHWSALSATLLRLSKGRHSLLTDKDKYFVLQIVYSALSTTAQDDESFSQRLKAYLVKAAREAKTVSSWEEPDLLYEELLADYAISLTKKGTAASKLRHFLQHHHNAAWKASLAQLVLKCTCPGIPDIYQGTEYPDHSFVDPDNRRPVDYAVRLETLDKLSSEGKPSVTTGNSESKMAVLYHLLQLRKMYPNLFASGTYEPVATAPGSLSFIRRYGNTWLWVFISLHQQNNLSRIGLPAEAPEQWTELFSGRKINASDTSSWRECIEEKSILVAWSKKEQTTRRAGVLMPLFSLPGNSPIGDMGAGAQHFLSFLSRSGQRIWQLLPLHPVQRAQHYSPYATASAFSGDLRYIDMGALVQEELLQEHDLIPLQQRFKKSVDYSAAAKEKRTLLTKTWHTFRNMSPGKWQLEYKSFLEKETWLEDYVLYTVLKKKFRQQPWYQWPEPFRDRQEKALQGLLQEDASQQELWFQFLFHRQWIQLRQHAWQYGILLMGDIPFYMSLDSADVWTNRKLFNIGADGTMEGVAGVPPDYFSATGQLWGMPTYNWAAQEKDNFDWWMKRLTRNLDLYDLVRLDHFRAFYDYWEVPGSATTARNGKWLKGPADKLFTLMQDNFPGMPFIAEDLGELHEQVFDLKNRYRIPGMRVLQFGFDPYMPASRDLPHNFTISSVAYTGTHDNTTALGWYRSLSREGKTALNAYAGHVITNANIADALCRMAYSSIADTAIVPLQDILGLDEHSRINTPAVARGNWRWRLTAAIDETICKKLREMVQRYNR